MTTCARGVLPGASALRKPEKRLMKQCHEMRTRRDCAASRSVLSGFLIIPSRFLGPGDRVYLEGRDRVLHQPAACTQRCAGVYLQGRPGVPGGAPLNSSAPTPSPTTVALHRRPYHRHLPVVLAARVPVFQTSVETER